MKQINGVRIDGPTLRVLRVLHENNGSLNTTEAKTLSGIADNDVVRRRFQKLANAGLAELDTDNDVDASHIPPKLCTLTTQGVQTAENIDFSALSEMEDERDKLVRIEKRLDQIEHRVYQIEEESGSDVSDLGIEEVRIVAEAMRNYLVEVHDADLGKYA